MAIIEDYWGKFKIIIPESASETQFKEMRKAFYAGFISMCDLQHSMVGMPNEKINNITKNLDQELTIFMSELTLTKQ